MKQEEQFICISWVVYYKEIQYERSECKSNEKQSIRIWE